jgi:NTE family protein
VSGDPLLEPDVLVLAGGGVLGEAWMSGVVGGLEDGAGIDMRAIESFVGTSAGSIVGARLAAGRRVRRPQAAGEAAAETAPIAGNGAAEAASIAEPPGRALPFGTAAARALAAAISPLVDPLLVFGAPGGAVARAALLARAPRGERRLDELIGWVEHIGARFDGRLRVCCVDRRSGRRVVFGAPGAPPAPVGEAVAASCSIPGVFEPVEIGGREYVDGGAWSQTNLDAAPVGRSTRVLCLNPVLGLPRSGSTPWAALRSAWLLRAQVELLALRRRGAEVRMIGPSPAAGELMSVGLMNSGPRDAVLAAGYRQGRELTDG